MATNTKQIAIKYLGSNRATETISIVPGTTVSDVIASLGLGAGFQLSNAKYADVVLEPTADIFATMDDGGMVYASTRVEAGV